MNIKICTDSTCDLTLDLLKENDITVTPLTIIKGGVPFQDGVDITPDDIFAFVDQGGSLCSTSAINIDTYHSLFTELSGSYDAVIEITLGKKFSSCYQNACDAAACFKNVYVVDSGNLSTGNGLMVMEAVRMRAAGMTAEEIVAALNDTRDRVETSFVLNKLDYMIKGGRCSMVAALGANLLRIKPSIQVTDGKMGMAEKYRGNYLKCVENYVSSRLNGREDICDDLCFITHSGIEEAQLQNVVNQVKSLYPFKKVLVTRAGCTITCHCGPGCLGILFIRKKEA